MPEVQDDTQPLVLLEDLWERARWKRDNQGPFAPMMAVEGQAVMDTVDWLLGRADIAPATEAEVAAVEDGAVKVERLRARDEEHVARGTDVSWRPGAIGRTLSWYLRFPGAEPPL